MKRPKAITIEWVDPWTGDFCAGRRMTYSPERAALSLFSRQAKALLAAARQWTKTRRPVLRVAPNRAAKPGKAVGATNRQRRVHAPQPVEARSPLPAKVGLKAVKHEPS